MTDRKALILSYNRDVSDTLVVEDPSTRKIRTFDLKQNISSITEEFFKEESLYNGYILFTKTFDNIDFQENNIYKVKNGFFEAFPNINSRPFRTFNDIKNFFHKDYWNVVEIKSNPPFYNGKILFLEEDKNNLIKKNKIYEVKNGIFIVEKDVIVPYVLYTYPFTSFEDIQNYFSKKGRDGVPGNPKVDSINNIIEIQE